MFLKRRDSMKNIFKNRTKTRPLVLFLIWGDWNFGVDKEEVKGFMLYSINEIIYLEKEKMNQSHQTPFLKGSV